MSSSSFPVIAVVGLSGAFPGAQSAEAFWRNLDAGAVSVRMLSESELRAAGVSDEALSRADYVRAEAMLENFDCFDAEFFGVSPRDAAMMDPQHRLMLEHAYAAIENAGYRPRGLRVPTGVYVGIGHNGYLLNNVQYVAPSGDPNGELAVLLGNDKSYAATRIAHRLNLRGPCMAVDTACSTSLVAIHMACAALLSHECDMALAGGARVVLPAGHGYFYTEGGVYARDGLCAPFDARATGTMQGSGVGMVVLKRLDDALAAGDCIRALIRATAVNNDGSAKIDYAAPSVGGQAEVIEAALALADVDPSEIGFVETHGTGTALGDPIEFAALERAFRRSTSTRSAPCFLGALKANIGHLDAAAGVAGLIKAVGVLESSRVPPLANFAEPNPRIDLQRSGFAIPTASTALPKAKSGRGLVCVSSFGIGGTNAHAVMEQAPECRQDRKTRSWHLLPIAARSQEALAQLARRMAESIDDAADLDAVAFTLQSGRDPMPWRGFLVVDSAQQVAQRWTHDISAWMAGAQRADVAAPTVAFQFPGQGTLPIAAAALLYREFPLLRRQLDLALADAPAGVRSRLLDPAASVEAGDEVDQVALVVLEYALARSLIELGVTPGAVIGHSLGEYVAAAVAGVFDLPTLIGLVQARGAAMAAMPIGAMLSIAISEREVSSLLARHSELDLAAVNAPRQCVVAGSEEAIVGIERHCAELGYMCRRLATRRAFHSRHTEAIAAGFALAFSGKTLRPASLPLISNVSGTSVVAEPCEAAYWVQHMRMPVRYGRGIEVLLAQPATVVLELGPGQVLSGLARAQGVIGAVAIHSQGSDPDASVRLFLQALGQLWQQGVEINFAALYEGEQRVRAALPSYPFERTRHWLDIDPSLREQAHVSVAPTPAPQVQLLLPSWRRAPRLPTADFHHGVHWVLVTDNSGVASGLGKILLARGVPVTFVEASGAVVDTQAPDAVPVSPEAEDGNWVATWQALRARYPGPMHIVYLRGVELTRSETEADFLAHFRRCFLPLLRLAAAVDDGGAAVQLSVITRQLFNVCGDETVYPAHAPLLGATRVIAQEHSALRVRLIDLPAADAVAGAFDIDAWLVEELAQDEPRGDVALRRRQRWCEAFETLPALTASPLPVHAGGRYLILGGLGGIGREIARRLAAQSNVHLILTGRAGLPGESEWTDLLNDGALDRELRARIECVQELRAVGSTVEIHGVDLRKVESARDWLDGLGRIDGAIHAVGVAGNGLSRLKSDQAMYQVMIAKIAPLLALAQSHCFAQLDFLLLCSSLSATVGGPGQADYAGANAYLEAFAASLAGRVPVLALAWDEWRDTGMSLRERDLSRWWDLTSRAPSWLDTDDWRSGLPFRIQAERDWVLREHRMAGVALYPGTGVVELMLSSFDRESLPISLRDLHWLVPAKADAAGGIDAALRIRGRGAERQLEFIDARPNADTVFASAWSDSDPTQCPPAVPVDLSTLRQRMHRPIAERDGEAAFAQLPASRTDRLALGPRWRCLMQAWLGDAEVLGRLRLDDRLLGDLVHFRAHPALLDVAAGLLAALLIDESQGEAIPVGIAEIRSYAPLTGELWSWVRAVGGNGSLRFDIDVTDLQGRVLLALRGFEMRRVGAVLAAAASPAQLAVDPASGITAEQALMPIGALLGCHELSTVIIARDSIEARRDWWRNPLSASSLARESVGVTVDDPDASALHRELAQLWAEQLGVSRLSLDHDFFELGGNSLSAMQVVAGAREQSGRALDVRALFDHPTLRKFAAYVERSGMAEAETTPDPSVDPAPRDRALPLSPQQQRLWFLSQMQDEAATYNIPIAMSLVGAFDIAKLATAMRSLSNAHEVLRTLWQLIEDEPRQFVMAMVPWPLRVVDVSGLDDDHRATEERHLLATDARRPFAWLETALHRTTVIRHHAQHHVLTWCLHHAICDHWSIGILVRDLMRAYNGLPLTPQLLQYADYAWQQAQGEARSRRDAGLAYWRNKLVDAPELLLLPTDFERTGIQTNRGGTVHTRLPASLVARLERVATQRGVSLYMLLLAGFKGMLCGLTGQTRIVVGTPVANRVKAYRDAVGFFANTIAIYTRFNLHDRFVDLLEAVRNSALEAYEHQDAPFEQVVDAVVQRRSLAFAPLVQAFLVLQNAPMSESEQAGLSVGFLDQSNDTAKFDFALVMYQDEHGIRCVTEYRLDLFVEATVWSLLDTYRTVLERVSSDPELPISELVAHKPRRVAPKMIDEEFLL